MDELESKIRTLSLLTQDVVSPVQMQNYIENISITIERHLQVKVDEVKKYLREELQEHKDAVTDKLKEKMSKQKV